ncbi:MAG: hypothetical protein RQ899_07385 [Pseudomonadales bacterium]|nr:hypothetical protein [Pseudomonadales bacterium]
MKTFTIMLTSLFLIFTSAHGLAADRGGYGGHGFNGRSSFNHPSFNGSRHSRSYYPRSHSSSVYPNHGYNRGYRQGLGTAITGGLIYGSLYTTGLIGNHSVLPYPGYGSYGYGTRGIYNTYNTYNNYDSSSSYAPRPGTVIYGTARHNPASVSYRTPSEPVPQVSLLKDIEGRCYQRHTDAQGKEIQVEIDPSECDF